MNNSDNDDFKNWQNGDENEMNNPNNWIGPNGSGFFYYGPVNPNFKKMWDNINNDDGLDYMKNYMNMDDILNNVMGSFNKKPNRPSKSKKPINVTFTQDEYLKLVEIRGYLAITEQFAHVKALDKVLNQIVMLPPNDPRRTK